MNLQTIWTTAAIADAAFALASLTMGIAFVRRVRLHGRAIVLSNSLFALAAFFATACVDAIIHTNASAPRFTNWTLATLLLQILVSVLVLHFYASSAGQLLASVGKSKSYATVIPWMAYLFLGIVLYRLDRADSSLLWLSSGHAVFPIGFFYLFSLSISLLKRQLPHTERKAGSIELVTLDLNREVRRVEPLSIPATAMDLYSLGTAAIPILAINGVSWLFSKPWEPWTVALYCVFHLAMLPSIAGLIYYQTRATFFDLLIKRGLALSALAILAILLVNAAPIGAAVAIVSMIFTFGWSLLHAELDTFLDRAIFGRPDYRRKLAEITAGISKTSDAVSAIESVTRELAEALRNDWVRFGESPHAEAQAIATVASPAKRWGVLSLGARRRGLAYQSQDATFVDGVASQLAAALEGFDSRAQRQLATEAEVRALRAQINPHFLFNSLNSLADMVKDSPQTEETVLNLARVFRYALDATQKSTVPLGDEMRFIESYLRIEQVRFEHRLRFEIVCAEDLCAVEVPPMLVQPLVENSIKHGLSRQLEGGSIRIVVTQAAALQIVVEDTGVGFDPKALREGGIGVDNVRRRVESLPEGRFTIDSQPGQGARITLEWKVV